MAGSSERRLPRLARAAAWLLVACALALWGRELWIAGKAVLAEVLISRAFATHLAQGGRHVPWSWADHAPIARLSVERTGLTRHVLTGATGASMAFGLGHIDGTAPPNGDGNCAVAGHRDTWMAFLAELRAGDRIRLVTRGSEVDYRVVETRVVEQDDSGVLAETPDPRLTLVTCWPFGDLRRSRLRYVVVCEPEMLRPPVPAGSGRASPPPSAGPRCSPA